MDFKTEELIKAIKENNISEVSCILRDKSFKISTFDTHKVLNNACENKGKEEIIKILFNDGRFDFSYQRVSLSSFQNACFNYNLEIIDLFLKSCVDVFFLKESILTRANSNDDPKVLRKLLDISRKENIELNYNYVLLDSAITPYFESTKTLLKDKRIDPYTDNNDFIFTLVLLYEGNLISENPEVLELVLNDKRFQFIKYDIEDFKTAHNKIEKSPFALYMLFNEIPELKNDLKKYLEKNLDINPEYQKVLDFINIKNKINIF